MNRAIRNLLSLSLLSLIAASGCTSFKADPDAPTETVVADLEPGDDVKLILTDGRTVSFTIEAIEDGALIGADQSVKTDDVRMAMVREVDPEKTAAATLSVFGLVLSIGLLLLIAAY